MFTILFVFFFFLCDLVSENLYGIIEFSDKTIFHGEIKLPASIRLHGKKQLQTIDSQEIQEIRFSMEKQEMLQAFWFPEPGKPDKEKSGNLYPVIYLGATISLLSGEKREGHLYTTVLYLTQEDKTKKLVLFYKMRGKEGESFENIVYPQKIVFQKTKPAVSSQISVSVSKAFLSSQISLITRPDFVRFSPEIDKGKFWIPLEHKKEGFFLAIYKHNQIFIQWPFPEDKPNMALVQTSLAFVQDFFDQNKLLSVWQSKEDTIYSLMLLQRKAKTTYNAKRKYPWRLEIWRWKYDVEEKRLMLAAREYFFRGILSEKEEPPVILLQESLTEKKSFKEEP